MVKSECLQEDAGLQSQVLDAGEFLKADKMSFGATLEDRNQRAALFAGLRGGWDTAYVASEEDKLEARRNNAILLALTVSIVVAPIAMVYYLAYC
jgi:hypothetical protein